MWAAYQALKLYNRRPSDDLDLEKNSISAWCVDATTLWFGIVFENALLETVKMGQEHKPRYELEWLLDSDFKLPRPLPKPRPEQQQFGSALATLLSLAGKPNSGVKQYRYVGPQSGQESQVG